ncbi:Dabb family protein [Leucobacter coleopterorum]|uniref:Dabb family protein n=1 Tax=Leucobacter coleopterorum TaxID=2714933 RepID=A0ABX6JYF0_9MICO|nr:Dabb family protein [Leucobacter coleopterorum]QIM17795.1 Dabb family protein [Leucobacter coleopterorum]
MTVRHIVTWKLSGESIADRDAQAAEIIAVLEPLNGRIDGLQSLKLYRNTLNHEANWDLTLESVHDDAEALAVYAAHPEHLAAVEIVKQRTVGRACVDFVE